MAVGTVLLKRLKANAVVTVEAGTVATAGGSQFSWATVVTGVDIIISQLSSSRDFDNGVYNLRTTCSVTGVHPALSRPDVRFKITAAGTGLTKLVGRYLSVVADTTHPAGGSGLVPARVSLACVVQEVPADGGSSL